MTTVSPLQPAKVFSCFLSRSCASLAGIGFLLVITELIVSMVAPTSNKLDEVALSVMVRIHRISLTFGRYQLVQLPRLAAPCSCS